MRDFVDACEHFGIRPALIFKDDVHIVGWTLFEHLEERSKCWGEIGENAAGLTQNLGIGDFKWCAGAGKHRHRIFECHSHNASLPMADGGDATGQTACFATGR